MTGCNIAYQLSQRGMDVAYLDFDFGSPTAGSILEVPSVAKGADTNGLHSYFTDRASSPHRVDVRSMTSRSHMRTRTPGSGSLVLYPGDRGGGEFVADQHVVDLAVDLLRALNQEFDVVIVDLSAGRSAAVDLSIRALAAPGLLGSSATVRWLVFHRWTQQHVIATSGLVYDSHGLVDFAEASGHDRSTFLAALRTVRTAVPDLSASAAAERPAQARWLRSCDDELKTLARELRLGQSVMLGATPLEPMLQWREQILTDFDVHNELANPATLAAFADLARKITDQSLWEDL